MNRLCDWFIDSHLSVERQQRLLHEATLHGVSLRSRRTGRLQKPPAEHTARTLYDEFESTSEPRGDSFLIQHLREVAIDHQNGIFTGTNDLVGKIGGRPPMTLEEFVNKNRAAFA